MLFLESKQVEPYIGNLRVLRSGVWIKEGEMYRITYDNGKEHVGVCCFDYKHREIGWWVKHRILHEFLDVNNLRIHSIQEVC